MNGKQVKLFLVDGTPGGPTTAEITNWTGHVLSARRSDLADLLKREEAQRTGVNRPGSGGGCQSMEDESHGSTQEVPRRVA